MILKYNIEINNEIIYHRLQGLINQTYKLLPMREQGKNWIKPLETLIEELCGMKRLIPNQDDLFFTLLCKMEGLFDLTDDEKDMILYRRIIFECLSLLNSLNTNVTI